MRGGRSYSGERGKTWWRSSWLSQYLHLLLDCLQLVCVCICACLFCWVFMITQYTWILNESSCILRPPISLNATHTRLSGGVTLTLCLVTEIHSSFQRSYNCQSLFSYQSIIATGAGQDSPCGESSGGHIDMERVSSQLVAGNLIMKWTLGGINGLTKVNWGCFCSWWIGWVVVLFQGGLRWNTVDWMRTPLTEPLLCGQEIICFIFLLAT